MTKIKIPPKGAIKDARIRGLGVNSHGDKISLYYYSSNTPNAVCVAESKDGFEFERSESVFTIRDGDKKRVDPGKLSGLKISRFNGNLLLDYQLVDAKQSGSFFASSLSLSNWDTFTKNPEGISGGVIVSDYKHKGNYVMYTGGKSISFGVSKDGESWKFQKVDLPEDKNYYIDFVIKTSQGIFVIYHTSSLDSKAMCFDINSPDKILWQTKTSLWQEPGEWKDHEVTCLGCVYFEGKLLGYWNISDVGIFLITYPVFESEPAHENHHYKLDKHPANPVLVPRAENAWENEAAFNPAAFYEDGKVYLIYRAVGRDYISVLGYAESCDGINFGGRLKEPIYAASEPFEVKGKQASYETAKKYMSGGGYGGCEDPRITKIGDRLYMIYVAFNGWEPPRLAMTSILLENFLNRNFLWSRPVLISPPGIIDKSGCLLPEKINGKYVIFHRIYPNILIDFVDNLEFDGKSWLKGEFAIKPRPNMWDSRKIGTGAPPIKTDEGWLLIYQGVGEADSSKYKVGAMLLDLNDPTKILHRSNHPIIEPTEHYENGLAKFGVVYPCGAVIVDGQLLVYYGGSDSVTCVASANLKEFLRQLTNDEGGTLHPIKLPEVD
jgi:predicted GH43/DUF377 family glycosyl hydrolase